MTGPYRVVILDSIAAVRAWQVWPAGGGDPATATLAKIAHTGEVPLLLPPGRGGFLLLCPGCCNYLAGPIGDVAVGGWEDPRWVLTGTTDKPTLAPSIGCGGWRRSVCIGHWWLRDGVLVLA